MQPPRNRRSSTSRPKKPEPEARGPDRSWSGALGGGAPAGKNRAANSNGNEGVTEGVTLGYRVIQEYLRQGERVARSFWRPDDGAELYDPSRLVDRAMRSAQDFAGAFGEIVRVLAKAVPPPPGAEATAAPARPNGRTATGGARRGLLALSVRSRRPVSVSLDLDESATSRALEVPPLRRKGRGATRSSGISVAATTGRAGLRVRVVVPPRAPRGTYEGPVLDARTKEPLGVIRVGVES